MDEKKLNKLKEEFRTKWTKNNLLLENIEKEKYISFSVKKKFNSKIKTEIENFIENRISYNYDLSEIKVDNEYNDLIIIYEFSKRELNGVCEFCLDNGLAIFNNNHNNGIHIEKCDTCDKFESDLEAWFSLLPYVCYEEKFNDEDFKKHFDELLKLEKSK